MGLIGRPSHWTWFSVVVGAFGLVHGLGLSTRLQALGLPENGLILRVLAFNLGVEIGQLAAVAVMYALGKAAARYITWSRLPRAANIALVLGGVLAAALVPFLAEPPAPVPAYGAHCQARDRTETFPLGPGHPTKDFTEPDEVALVRPFGHVIGDGFVIVQYRPDIPAEQLTALRTYVTDPASGRVVGGANQQPEAVKAVHAYGTLTCTTVDVDAIRGFARTWFADPRAKPVQ